MTEIYTPTREELEKRVSRYGELKEMTTRSKELAGISEDAVDIIFARKISITSSELVTALKTYSKSLDVNASVGIGPFSVKGSYGQSESGRNFDSTSDGQTLMVPGMQILGFVNRLIPKAPNPLPDLKPEDFG